MTKAVDLAKTGSLVNSSGQVPLDTGVTGTLPVANGGTGQTTQAGAANAILPSQTGNSGKYLTTNGTDASWGTIASSQWTTTGSDIYYNTGNVGIGTSSPTGKLQVNGTGGVSGSSNLLYVNVTSSYGGISVNSTANNNSFVELLEAGTKVGGFNADTTNNVTSIQSDGGHALAFNTGGTTERGRFDTSGNFQFNSGYGSVATAYGCRAWVKFSATTGSINGSGNVSSVSDNGTGNFTVNFSSAMPDTNYAWIGTADPTSGQTSDGAVKVVFGRPDTNPTTSAIALLTCSSGFGRDDMESAFVAVFR